MITLSKGRYVARQSADAADIAAAQTLRARCFDLPTAQDIDAFDPLCTHFLVEDRESGALVCCFRLQALHGADLHTCYAAQYYGLGGLQSYQGLLVELGRFCVHPDCQDGDILRVAWAAMTVFVDENDVQLLFGCSSFAGTETDKYLDAFAMLRARHLAPGHWLPQIKAPDTFHFTPRVRRDPDARKAMAQMPPLLRTYLLMGGWVSDHAVIDHRMNTLHVFTGLEIGAIPATRKRLLRALV